MDEQTILRLLEQLSERLEGPGRYVFELAVRNALIMGVSWLLLGLLLGALALVLLLYARRQAHESAVMDEPDGFLAAVFGMAAVGLAVFLCVVAVPSLLNPEYAALKDLLSSLRP